MHINCGEMHSDLDQEQRNDVMFKFKSGQIDVLVATDIVSRGIDIDDIAMVINMMYLMTLKITYTASVVQHVLTVTERRLPS